MTSISKAIQPLSPSETRAIAKEATIYGFPLVDNYRVQYSYFVDRGSPEFKAPWNVLSNTSREPAAIDNQIVIRMNRDTLYSAAVFDLDAGSVTITLPETGKRFMSMQVIDEDHYCQDVFYGAGKHTLSREQIG
ncbi:MAG TPA: DUF1254 domain-containing protein, partial [Acetobacteraceae bacterium]|nr:DUF1254 domain-containing protein [Acetobacteraceae bacterium]